MSDIEYKVGSLKEHYENLIINKYPNQEKIFSKTNCNFSKAVKHSNENNKALDLGYGYGNYTIELASKGYHIDAIDIIDKSIFKNRIKKVGYKNNINIFQSNINEWDFKDNYSVIVCKDVLHFLDKKNVSFILEKCQETTLTNGINYFVVFTDIIRKERSGKQSIIKNEAQFKTKELLDLVLDFYKNWDIKININKYIEKDKKNTNIDYFTATKVEFLLKKQERTRYA